VLEGSPSGGLNIQLLIVLFLRHLEARIGFVHQVLARFLLFEFALVQDALGLLLNLHFIGFKSLNLALALPELCLDLLLLLILKFDFSLVNEIKLILQAFLDGKFLSFFHLLKPLFLFPFDPVRFVFLHLLLLLLYSQVGIFTFFRLDEQLLFLRFEVVQVRLQVFLAVLLVGCSLGRLALRRLDVLLLFLVNFLHGLL